MAEYEKISDTEAEKTENLEKKTKITLDLLYRRKTNLLAQLGRIKQMIEDVDTDIVELKKLEIKDVAEIATEKEVI